MAANQYAENSNALLSAIHKKLPKTTRRSILMKLSNPTRKGNYWIAQSKSKETSQIVKRHTFYQVIANKGAVDELYIQQRTIFAQIIY